MLLRPRLLWFLAGAFVVTGCGFGGSDRPGDRPDAALPGDAPARPDAPDVTPDAPPDAAPLTPLETEITSGPTGSRDVGSQLAYAFTGSAGATFECRVDQAAFAACSSPHAITAELGAHVFAVRSVDGARVDETPATRSYTGIAVGTRIRLVAGNITSGTNQAYEDPGTRIFQGLAPDIAMVQEMNIGNNSATAVRAWVDTAFGANFQYFRESGAQIPNGVVSRYPILAAGVWEDPQSPNREFVWARIDVPGAIDLWAVSVHLLTDDAKRPAEATALVGYIQANVPAGDYLLIAGDFNTDARTETAVVTLGQVVKVGAPWPADQGGDEDTNRNRNSPYDWVMLDADLAAREVPTVIGAAAYPSGLVFDSRVYMPLADVMPVQEADSAATNMQHMAVIKDVVLPAP